MKEVWNEITTLFMQIAGLYTEILALSKEKQQVLIAAQPDALESVIAQEEALLLRVQETEVQRGELLQKMAAASGRKREDLTLSLLIELAQPQQQVALKQIQERLERVIGELKEVNALNTRLAEKALFFVNCNINLLTQNVADANYGPQHAQAQPVNGPIKRLMIDRKV